MSDHNVWQNAGTRVTLLWQTRGYCSVEIIQQRHVTSAVRPFLYDHLILLIWYDKILQRRELNQSLWITSSSLWSDQGFLHHLEFLNPRYALPSQHYITLTPLSSYFVPVCALVLCVLYSRACKTGNLGDAEHV